MVLSAKSSLFQRQCEPRAHTKSCVMGTKRFFHRKKKDPSGLVACDNTDGRDFSVGVHRVNPIGSANKSQALVNKDRKLFITTNIYAHNDQTTRG